MATVESDGKTQPPSRSSLFFQSREASFRIASYHPLGSTFGKLLKKAVRFGIADISEHFHRTKLPELCGTVFQERDPFQDGG
jgi:hypothetical protein